MLKRKGRKTSDLFESTLSNAERLLNDSKLLLSHDRFKSATILGVFALEELGKALIIQWGVRNLATKREHPTHVEKQTATFALLSANELLLSDRKRIVRHIEKGTFDSLKIGPLSHQFAWARAGFYDDLRMSATYADKEPKIPTDLVETINAEFVAELHADFTKALSAFENDDAMGLAAHIYSNGLGRL